MSTLNEKLRILMENQCWTQKRLAERMCVSPDTVSSWVRGINHPSLETVKELCEIFYIPIQQLTNDNIDIPEYFELEPWDAYIDYGDLRHPGDSVHTIIDADLAYEGMLHRFTNKGGAECSAIYRGNMEMWWHYREHEAKMIREWNEVHGELTDDRAKNVVSLYGALLSMNERAGADATDSVRNAGYVVYAYLGGQAKREITYLSE